ncbi:MAG: DUF3228 family protein [Candidatus Obscuribacterales bacterium]|nr:DUF3228 family protein [Candidatus Obscuribacterales bacterium]
MKSIALNPMVYRQKPSSRFSHWQPTANQCDGDDYWPALLDHLNSLIENGAKRTVLRPDGLIVKYSITGDDCQGFFSAVAELAPGDELKAVFATRAGAVKDEEPFVQVTVIGGKKLPARHVDLIFYHRDALTVEERTLRSADGSTSEVSADWQLVSMNARATEADEPPTPKAMARNMACALGLPEGIGGTARSYTAEEFMYAINYWSRRALVEG